MINQLKVLIFMDVDYTIHKFGIIVIFSNCLNLLSLIIICNIITNHYKLKNPHIIIMLYCVSFSFFWSSIFGFSYYL